MSEARVMLEVMRRGPLARAELARRLALSPASLTRIVAPLVSAGLVRETGESASHGVGRPSRPLDVVADARHFVGVKVAADAAYGVLTDLHARPQRRAETALSDVAPEAVTKAVCELVADLADGAEEVTAMGVSLGGAVVDHRTVRQAPFLGWSEVEFGELLEECSGLHAVVDNDVVALTKAEQWFGLGRTAERFGVVTIGIGVGYGLVVHDRVVEGLEAGLGMLGHYPVDPHGPWCDEGHRGCAAVSLAAPSIVRAVSLGAGRPVEYEEALDLAADGDAVAAAVVDDAGRALGRLIALVSNALMTDQVVLAGEGSRLAEVGRRPMEDELRAWRLREAGPVELQVRDTDNEQWACGAAVSAMQDWVGRAWS